MEFEFDENKSQSNLEKHGIDFSEAQKIWDDLDRAEARSDIGEEERFIVIGRIGLKSWSAVITYREGKIRIISVRRSRKEEVSIYEANKNNGSGVR